MKKNRESESEETVRQRGDRFVTVSELAKRWAISESAVYQGKCGTKVLTRIRFGNALRFLREEVEGVERDLIRKASRYPRQNEDVAA